VAEGGGLLSASALFFSSPSKSQLVSAASTRSIGSFPLGSALVRLFRLRLPPVLPPEKPGHAGLTDARNPVPRANP
jgi:hypothetical protein